MIEVYLIEYSEGDGYRKEDKVFSTQQKAAALSFLGDVATGKNARVTVKSIYRANLTKGTLTKQQLQLNDTTLKLDLVEFKPRNLGARPDGPEEL